jgi:tripartite-type tricarboxylate transporter receptor subunit TctC
MNARSLVVSVCLVLLVLSPVAAAQSPVRLIVGGPPGGNTDVAARLASERLSQALGAPVVVENRPGAGGVVAGELVKNAKPDGTVVGLVTASNAANETLMRSKSYSLTADLEPVGLYAWLANVLIVSPSIPATSLPALVAALKARAKNDYASGGIGSPGHLSGETFKLRTGVAMDHVPYKGAPPAVLSVVTGETALMFATASAALPQIKAGKVQALAVTSQSRLAELPAVPTLAEAGLGTIDVLDWVGFVVPKGTPDDVKQKLHAALTLAYADPVVRQKLEQNTMLAAQPALGPAEFGRFLARDVAKWARTIDEANIKAE